METIEHGEAHAPECGSVNSETCYCYVSCQLSAVRDVPTALCVLTAIHTGVLISP
jgi:hypothetical protein